MARILLAEDDEIMRITLFDRLSGEGWDVEQAADGKEAFVKIKAQNFHLVISDIRMPGLDGISLLKQIKKISPDTEVILMTAYGGVDNAIDCLKKGAADYVLKPFDMDDLSIRVNRLLEQQIIKNKYSFFEEKVKAYKIVGNSLKMDHIFRLISSVAQSDATVLITGESGTGKELVATAIHEKSKRSAKPYIRLNCAAIPENLIESELFGHEKGAFTGADCRKVGKFELADTGTILLDEIGDMPINLQVKLLRVLEEREVETIGGIKPLSINVRVLCSTAKNLDQEVKEGRFRMDLLYRLKVFPIEIPPLRERSEDIPELCQYFLQKFGDQKGEVINISEKALQLLTTYNYPGNVRELRNILERASILVEYDTISVAELPSDLTGICQNYGPSSLNLAEAVACIEQECIKKALEETAGKKTEAAKLLGISRKNLWEKLKLYSVEKNVKS